MGQDHLWAKAVSEYSEKLSPADREIFERRKVLQLDTIIASISQSSSSTPKGPDARTTLPPGWIDKVQHLGKLLAIFTSSLPDVSYVIWVSIQLLSERSNVNSETRRVFEHVVDLTSACVPHFNAYEEVFSDMAEVEASMIKFYSAVIDFFVAAIERMKACSSWTHRIGVDPAPIPLQRAALAVQNQKGLVEKHVATANIVLQNKRHIEIRKLLADMALESKTNRESNLPCHVIPYSANPLFHGRREILDRLQAHFAVSRNERRSFAISGLGGIGKTQIALKYIYDRLDEYPVVFWMRADTQQKLAESYVLAAKQLQIEPEDSQKDTESIVSVLKTWLTNSAESWLVIYDNADDLSVLKPFWPPGNRGNILITSRNPSAERMTDSGVRVSPLSPDEGETLFVSLLTSRGTSSHEMTTHSKQAVTEILKKLGYLPLAVVQVSGFILECDCTLEEFQQLYDSAAQSNQGLSELEPTSVNLFYEYSLATVWKVSILKLGPNSLKLLRLMSLFDPDGVPESLLWAGADKTRDGSLKFLRKGFPYFTALQELISHGLIIKADAGAKAGYSSAQAKSLTIHRLVQETVFHQLATEEQAKLLNDALELVWSAWPYDSENPFRMNASWPVCSLYLPHVLAFESRCRDASYLKPSAGFVGLFFSASWCLFERRMSELAFPLLGTARVICTQNGNNDPFLPKLLTAHGAVCLECDSLAESAESFTGVVDIYRARYNAEKKLGQVRKEYDWLLATSLSDLGCTYTGLGEFSKSEALFDEGLAIARTISDEKARKDWSVHVGHNLARLYTETDRPEKALELHFEYGDEFANGLIQEQSQRGALFLYGIGNAYLALGRKQGVQGAQARASAFDYHTRALRIRQQELGQHYVTAISLHKIGVLLHEVNNDVAASESLAQALEIFEQSFKADREKARSMYYLSRVKRKLGKLVEADSMLSTAWQYLSDITGAQRSPEVEKDSRLFDKLVLYVQN